MKTSPLLLFSALLFWGWQSHLLWVGALVGAALESARLIKMRWELEDVDFHRIMTLCFVVTVALAAYVFTTNDEGGGMGGMFHGPAALHNVSTSSTLATTSVLRWLPLIYLPIAAAQIYNLRPSVPLTAISIVLRLRRQHGDQSLVGRYVDVSYPYFMVCIFAASIHNSDGTYLSTYAYFWGQAILILWTLWTLRTGRHGLKTWLVGLAVVLLLGLLGQVAVSRLDTLVQRLDAQLFSHLFHANTDPTRSATALGQIGELELSPRIVIRLEPGQVGIAPSYLREASYRYYQPVSRSWSAKGGDFGYLPTPPDGSTWTLLPAKSATHAVSIACYLNGRAKDEPHVPEGVLPLPSGTWQLAKLPASQITLQTNQNGAVLAAGLGLLIFDAQFGPGATFDAPPEADTNSDLEVPRSEAPALDQVITEMNLTNTAADDKRLAVAAFFGHHFTYSTWQGPEKRATTNASPLTRFLLTSRSGHCEYFATATVLLLRRLGIPARYAVGYSVHETSGSGYVVRERDAHAWCLAWNQQTKTWEDFDTTPASWVAIEGQRASLLDTLSDLRSWLTFQFEKLRWRQTQLRQYVLWMFVPVALVLLYYILFKRRLRGRAAVHQAATAATVRWPGQDSAFYRLEQALAARGRPRPPQETQADWLAGVLAEPALAQWRAPAGELLQLHYRYRFDPHGLSAEEISALRQKTGTLLAALAEAPAEPSVLDPVKK